MGVAKNIVISGTGYPLNNETLRYMQSAYSDPLGALAFFVGNKAILSGLEVTSPAPNEVRAAGYVSFNGEILQFQSGTKQDTVTVIETTVNAEYDKDTNGDGVRDNAPVFKSRHMEFGTGGIATFPFTDLYRVPPFTQLLLEKLNGIATGAQVNVKPDWNAASTAENGILNKPILLSGSTPVGDLNGGTEITVTFSNLGTASYIPLLSIMANNPAQAGLAATVVHAFHSRTTTSFKIWLNETGSQVQDITVFYTLIKI